MNNGLVYLAGPITGESFGTATDWRVVAASKLAQSNIVGLSPLRHKEYLSQETSIKDQYVNGLMSTQRAITVRDRFDCMRCDMALVYLTEAKRVSIGTMMELGWLNSRNVPIVIVMESGNLHDHAMVREVAAFITPDLNEAIDIIKRILVP